MLLLPKHRGLQHRQRFRLCRRRVRRSGTGKLTVEIGVGRLVVHADGGIRVGLGIWPGRVIEVRREPGVRDFPVYPVTVGCADGLVCSAGVTGAILPDHDIVRMVHGSDVISPGFPICSRSRAITEAGDETCITRMEGISSLTSTMGMESISMSAIPFGVTPLSEL